MMNANSNIGGVSGESKKKKALFLILFIFSGVLAFGQKYTYRFEIQEVTDGPGAKMAVSVIRPLFNTEEDPFVVFPAYDRETGKFNFKCDLLVTKEQLAGALMANDYTLTAFVRDESIAPTLKSEEK